MVFALKFHVSSLGFTKIFFFQQIESVNVDPEQDIASADFEQNEASIQSQQVRTSVDTQQVRTHNNPLTKKTTSSTIAGKRKNVSEDVILEKMDKAYDALTKRSNQKENDECEIFGQLVAKRLQKMEQTERDYVMHEIENVIYQAKLRFSHNTKNMQSLGESSAPLYNAQNWTLLTSTVHNSDHTVVSGPSSSASQRSQVPPSPYSQYDENSPLASSLLNEESSSAKSFYESFQ